MKYGILIGVFLLIQSTLPFDLNHLLKLYEQEEMSEKTKEEKDVEYFKVLNPSGELKLKNRIGQIGGLDTDEDGNLLVFHRASRNWEYDSFFGNNFNRDKYKSIAEPTVTLINPQKQVEISSWGENRFYMPHGLTLDFAQNIWLTDVALHQVFKFNKDNLKEPELVIGVEFTPGNDENHLCKPTGVAVSSTSGHVYISDGYCNQRIVEFDQSGNYLGKFEDTKKPLEIVHSIALIEKLNLVCTVSRQDGRIVCFDLETREKTSTIKHKDMLNCYAIEYDAENELIHAASGHNEGTEAYGFTFFADENKFGKLKQKWNSPERELNGVHDLAVSKLGSTLYLGQLNGEIDEFVFE